MAAASITSTRCELTVGETHWCLDLAFPLSSGQQQHAYYFLPHPRVNTRANPQHTHTHTLVLHTHTCTCYMCVYFVGCITTVSS